MSHVRLEGVRKTFGDLVALDGVSFEARDGSFFVLLGPSGAGKTTTLRVIAGLERPDAGEVYVDDAAVGRTSPAARDVAMVFQSYALYPKKSAYDNIASPLRARAWSGDDIDARVREVAGLLHIDHLLARPPGQLSGGEQQRVALGRSLVREPRVFLMDEPLTNLDVKLRVEMRAELSRLHRQVGQTFVYVTNDQAEAMSMADRVAVLHRGRIQQVGTPAEVYDHPANRFVATFVGSSRMNLLPCRVDDDVLVGEDGWRLPVPDGAAPPDRPLELGVRPEDLSLDARGEAGRRLEGAVYALEPLGDRTLVDVQVGEQLVRVKAAPTVDLETDARVGVAVDLDRSHLFDRETGESVTRATAVRSSTSAPA